MLVPILVVLGCIILVPIIIQIGANIGMKKSLGKRGDGTVSIRYPLPSEQKDLIYKKDYFFNDQGNRFAIFEYRHKNVKNPNKILLMIHGLGCGHFYLFPLINYFAKLGYLVLAYDQYASGCSEGTKIDSMTVGARDVKFALNYIDKNYPKLPLYVFGHSWGGFTASIALNYSKRIEKAIIISGFNRMSDFVRVPDGPGVFIGFLLSLAIISRDSFLYKKDSTLSALDCFQKTKAKVLYLQGSEDKVVKPEYSSTLFMQLCKNPNVQIKVLKGKGHTPFVTNKSQIGQDKVSAIFGTVGGNLVPIETYFDYEKISEPDLQVYKMMSDFLAK